MVVQRRLAPVDSPLFGMRTVFSEYFSQDADARRELTAEPNPR